MLRKSFGFAVVAVLVSLALETTSSAAILGVATLVKDPANAIAFGAPDAALGAPWVSYKLSLTADGADTIQAVVADIQGQLHQRWTSSNVDGVYDTATGNSTNATNGDSHFMAITAGSAMLFANGPNEDNPATGSPLTPSNNDSTGWGVGTSMSATFGPAGAALTAIDVAYLVVPKDAIPTLNIAINVFNPTGDLIDSLTEDDFFGVVPGDVPVVTDFTDSALLNETIATTLTATNSPTSWSNLLLPTYTPGFGAKPNPAGIHLLPTWNPATQQFSWNTTGSTRGTYTWTVDATNPTGTSTGEGRGLITINVPFVPEPSTMTLFGLAIAGVVGMARRRS